MTVTSPLEIPLTVLGWLLYDTLWAALSDWGLVFVPFILVLLGSWVKAREKQDDAQAARATVRVMETRLIVMFSVIVLAAQPQIELGIGGLGYSRQVCDGGAPATVTLQGGATGTTYDQVFTATTLGGQSAKVPIWWYGVMLVSGTLTDAAIAGLPCKADLRGMAYKLNLNPVRNDPALTRETARFYGECYLRALNKYVQEQPALPDGLRPVDLEWMGSVFFRTTAGYYPDMYAEQPVAGFAVQADRLPDSHAIRYRGGTSPPAGYPSCHQWWLGTAGNEGLLQRLTVHLIGPAPQNYHHVLGWLGTLAGSLKSWANGMSDSEFVIRGLIDSDDVVARLGRQAVDRGYTSDRDLGDTVASLPAWIGAKWEKASFHPRILMIREATRNVQAILLLAVYTLLPFVLVFSHYSFSTLFLASVGVFAIKFIGFLWALAFWLDSHLLDSLKSAGIVIPGLAWLDVRVDVIDFVVGATYIVLPVVWMMVLAWAGLRIGTDIAGATRDLGSAAAAAGARGGAIARDAVTNGIGGGIRSGSQRRGP